MKIGSLLIANRGEIAVRIAKTARRLGLEVVGLASNLDINPLHKEYCDKILFLKGNNLSETYLNIEQIVDLMTANRLQAVHPGYGFLSENEDFAAACAAAGLIFVGPTADTIAAMGSKARAKDLMRQAGVPIVPGYQGRDQSDKILLKEAQKIGFPLLVKASAGGGGKGMRIVKASEDLAGAITQAKSEALKAFGDDHVILEKYVENPRHIEFQIFGDSQGNLVHLGERECSIQRRHQKIIEESPSPALTESLRAKMAEAALQCGRALAYQNAGTVEFILDQNQNFYFLEVNTRLQVEHPITEMRTGLDLVEWQIRVAEGEALPLTQNEIAFSGHALECRVYAEDPVSGFLPSIGTLHDCIEPQGPFLRIDSGVAKNSEISLHFDPMIAKVVTWGRERAQAISVMQAALKNYVILGVKTNQAFLGDVLSHSEFQNGKIHTHFLSDHFAAWQDAPSTEIQVLAQGTWKKTPISKSVSAPNEALHDVWQSFKNFRVGGA